MAKPTFPTDRAAIKFARSWLWGISGFVLKNMRVCLTENDRGEAAYFPALMEACAYFDLLASLYTGKKQPTVSDLQSYAGKFLDPIVYTPNLLEILWYGYRHKIAHHAHPEWVFDTATVNNMTGGRKRIVFEVSNADFKPAIQLKQDAKPTLTTPKPMVPWDVPYDHRIIISPLRIRIDLHNSLYGSGGYLAWMEGNPQGLIHFTTAMLRFFPPARQT